ncbi:MAG: hypothetical protein OEX00_08325, partial [Gammaproteobacteria bacterium]|nr:hypothetical protein [Gammaproteobacteria bacterium]
ISQPGAHRHALDDTGGTKGSDWGIISSITDAGFLGIYPAIGSYIIGADNRIRLIIVTGSEAQVISGALSSDHEVIVVNPTTEERSAEMTIGIRASASTTAFQATDGRVLSWNGYSIDHTRSYSTTDASFIPSNDTVDDINLRNNASIGINRISNDGTNVAFTSINYDNALQVSGIPGGPFTVNNAAANFSAFGDDSNSMTMTVTAFNNIFGGLNDGAGTINMGSEKSFIASTASGSVTLMLPVDDYIGDTTPGDAAGGTVNHHMGMTLMTELATVGTHTRESLTGRYVLSSIWDEFSPDASTGLGVMRFGNQTGEIYLKNDGTIAVDITDKDSVGRVEIIKVNGTYFESSLGSNVTPRWTISSVCIGHSDSPTNKVRLAPNDSACTGGIIVDMVVGYLDPIETPTDLPVSDIWAAGVSRFAAFFVDTSGKTLSFTDAKVLDAPSDRRLLGYAVRIQ